MAAIRVLVPDEYMQELKDAFGLATNNDVVQEALTILNWAKEESLNRRFILASDKDGDNKTRLAMPILAYAREKGRAPK